MIKAFLRYLKLRRKRRYLKWVAKNHIVYLAKPSPDERNWQEQFQRSLRGRRY